MADQPFNSKESMKKFVLEAAEEMSELLKTIQHPKRLKIMALLIDEERDFRTLMTQTRLQKSALGNHLSELQGKHIVEKITRGIYRLTMEGHDYIENLSINFMNSKISFSQEPLAKLR